MNEQTLLIIAASINALFIIGMIALGIWAMCTWRKQRQVIKDIRETIHEITLT